MYSLNYETSTAISSPSNDLRPNICTKLEKVSCIWTITWHHVWLIQPTSISAVNTNQNKKIKWIYKVMATRICPFSSRSNIQSHGTWDICSQLAVLLLRSIAGEAVIAPVLFRGVNKSFMHCVILGISLYMILPIINIENLAKMIDYSNVKRGINWWVMETK